MKKLKKVLRVILILLLVMLIIIQFIRPAKNSAKEIAANQITAVQQVPDRVQQILQVSCYDCHSNTTHYPWYSKIQPAAWYLNDHITEGKRELNFSEFANYPPYRRYKKFKEIQEQIKQDEMPLFSYTLIHRDAVLNTDQKLLIQNWAAGAMKDMEAKYPADSLVKPK
jgi:hypothetical protein